MAENTTMGLDEEVKAEVTEAEKVVQFGTENARRPFAYWTVGGTEYRMKLKSKSVVRLEDKFGCNILKLIQAEDTLPRLGVMLTMIQAAMQDFNHGMTFDRVQDLYDEYCEEGGTQMTLLTDVVLPMMAVSGFFTANQTRSLDARTAEVRQTF